MNANDHGVQKQRANMIGFRQKSFRLVMKHGENSAPGVQMKQESRKIAPKAALLANRSIKWLPSQLTVGSRL
jgi:hypothetical protein